MNRILALQKLEVKEDTKGEFFESIVSVLCSARSVGGCHITDALLMKPAEKAEKE